MANGHSKFEDDVPQFRGKLNKKFVEWVTDVRLKKTEQKDETKARLGPRLLQERTSWTTEANHQDNARSVRLGEFHSGQHHRDAEI